jgi:hypothetical protein
MDTRLIHEKGTVFALIVGPREAAQPDNVGTRGSIRRQSLPPLIVDVPPIHHLHQC